MIKKQSYQKWIWIVLVGIMILGLLIIFSFPLFDSSFWKYNWISYQHILFRRMENIYPLDLIIYVFEFLGVIYLTLTIPKDKIANKIRYIISILTIIIMYFIISRWVYSEYVLKDCQYEYFNEIKYKLENNIKTDKLTTGYNILDFILWKQ